MHNSFILQQYVCYPTILSMFRAAVQYAGAYCTAVCRVTIPEAVVIQFVLLRMRSVLLETC